MRVQGGRRLAAALASRATAAEVRAADVFPRAAAALLARAQPSVWLPAQVRRPVARLGASARAFSTNDTVPSLLDVKVAGGVATITLADERKRNALSSTLMAQLRDEIRRLGSGAEGVIKAAIIRHDGKVFSSGHDLKELHMMQKTQGSTEDVFSVCGELMIGVRDAEFPVIAVVNGLATAGGCQLVAMCDLAIVSDTSSFATPGVKIGLFCTTPGVALARAIPNKAAMLMLLSGNSLSATEALQLGLVSKVVPSAQLDAEVQQLAASIAQAATATVRLGKKAFYQQAAMPDIREAYEFAKDVMVDNMKQPDAQEGIAAFIEKRVPKWTL